MNRNQSFDSLPGQEHSYLIHACPLCSSHEIDPVKRDRFGWVVVKYRGTFVSFGASNGCPFFQSILDELSSICKDNGHDSVDSNPPRLENWVFKLSVSCGLSSNDCKHVQTSWVNPVHNLSLTAASFGILALPGDPASEYVLSRPIFQDYMGVESRGWIADQLKICTESHPDCQKSVPSSPPKRLLRLTEAPCPASADREREICVVLAAIAELKPTSIPESYTALSYCWGGDQSLKLNEGSLPLLRQGILASRLPKTLRDAIHITWELGLRLIWIDCLCIRQDDVAEIASEVAKAPSIYGNAHITIAASRAVTSDDGFLQPPISHPPAGKLSFQLPYTCPSGKLGSVVLYRLGPHNGVDPINSRAWTFQESVLSRRIVHYTSLQLRWTCRTLEAFQIKKNEYFLDFHELYTKFYAGERSCKLWMELVWLYSGKELSYPRDTLPAISGIATLWAKSQISASYVAGIWRSHLPMGLLWVSEQPHLQTEMQLKEYTAPSWSWASLNGSIAWWSEVITRIDPGFSIIDCATELSHAGAPYGAVRSGYLKVEGSLQRALWPVGSLPSGYDPRRYIDLSLANLNLDFEDEILQPMIRDLEIFCLRVSLYDEETQRGPCGLVLAKNHQAESFRRVGAFFFEPPDGDDISECKDFNKLMKRHQHLLATQRGAFYDSMHEAVEII